MKLMLMVELGLAVFRAVMDAQEQAKDAPGAFKKAVIIELMEEVFTALGGDQKEWPTARAFVDRAIERVVNLMKKFAVGGKKPDAAKGPAND